MDLHDDGLEELDTWNSCVSDWIMGERVSAEEKGYVPVHTPTTPESSAAEKLNMLIRDIVD